MLSYFYDVQNEFCFKLNISLIFIRPWSQEEFRLTCWPSALEKADDCMTICGKSTGKWCFKLITAKWHVFGRSVSMFIGMNWKVPFTTKLCKKLAISLPNKTKFDWYWNWQIILFSSFHSAFWATQAHNTTILRIKNVPWYLWSLFIFNIVETFLFIDLKWWFRALKFHTYIDRSVFLMGKMLTAQYCLINIRFKHFLTVLLSFKK